MALGMEVEFARPLQSQDGKVLKGDTDLLLMPLLMKLVSDYRQHPTSKQIYSNAEFVLTHFDQHAGQEENALAELDVRLQALRLFVQDLYREDADKPLSSIVSQNTAQAHQAFVARRVDPAMAVGFAAQRLVDAVVPAQTIPIPGNATQILVHYTVGVPVDALGPALTHIAGITRPGTNKNYRLEHAKTAELVATQIISKLMLSPEAAKHVNELSGFLALVFTHLGAFADIMENSPEKQVLGQPKNFIAALSRVPLQEVFKGLRPEIQHVIVTNAKNLYELLGEKVIGTFADGDSRQVDNLAKVTIQQYAMSAFGYGDPVSQERVFGGMTETGLDPSVRSAGDPDPKVGRGVPLELRAAGPAYPDWNQLVQTTIALLKWSRTIALPNPKFGSADHWLPELARLLPEYEKTIGQASGPDSEVPFDLRFKVTHLCSEIAEVFKLYPGFPGRLRDQNWKVTGLAGLASYDQFMKLTQVARAQVPDFSLEPFATYSF